MMNQRTIVKFSLPDYAYLLITILLFAPGHILAEGLIDQSKNIFKFQQRLAQSGNAQAQFKLASMYENGDGVSKNIEEAEHWYVMAASAGSSPAEQRGKYLKIKQRGYDTKKDTDWLNSILSDYKKHKPDAILLLGQLYSEGIGVKRNLHESLKLLERVSTLGTANVDNQIAVIESRIAQLEKAEHESKALRIKQVEQDDKEAERLAQQLVASSAKQQEASLNIKAEKRRKYEEVMRKLNLEQAIIDAQQSAVSGGGNVGVDDEF